jgi:hypothetical protein
MPDNNLQPLLDTQQNELAAQANLSDTIESRNLGILAANIAVLIYVGQSNFILAGWQWLLLLGPFLLSAIANFMLMLPAKYESNADLAEHPEYLTLDPESLVLQLLSDTQTALTHNKMLNQKRMQTFLWGLRLTIIGIVVLFVTIKVWAT